MAWVKLWRRWRGWRGSVTFWLGSKNWRGWCGLKFCRGWCGSTKFWHGSKKMAWVAWVEILAWVAWVHKIGVSPNFGIGQKNGLSQNKMK